MTISSPRHEFDYVETRSCLRAQCNCLCGTGACRCCCRGCPFIKESTATRVVYISLLVIFVFIMALFMSPEVQNEIMTLFPNNFSVCEWLGAGTTCHAGRLMGYLVVYRIGFAVAVFHLILVFSTCGVRSSKDCRSSLHNGLWLYKIMMLVFIFIMAFLIPDHNDYFINVWMWIAMISAALFIVIQLILLVFLVHKLTDKMQKRVEKGSSAVLWYSVVAPSLSVLLFAVSGAGIAFLYVYFASDHGCHKNQWFILINAFGCVIVSVVAAVRTDKKPVSLRFVHASLICVYVTYLTWVAISSAPRRYQRFARPVYPTTSTHWSSTSYRPKFTSFHQDYYCGPVGEEEAWLDRFAPYVSFVVTLLTVVIGSIGVSEPEKCNALELPGCPRPESDDGFDQDKIDDSGGQVVVRNEKKSIVYSYSLFHFMLMLACLLMMMHLTHWHTPNRATLMTFGRSWSSVWVKIASSWVCLIFYFTTILCPSILPSVIPTVGKMSRAPSVPVVETNGRAYDSDAETVSEEAVPLNIVHRPTFIGTYLETTV